MGYNNDGLEVYETCEAIKKLSFTERKDQFLNFLLNEYKGRTAKFWKNGEALYATFEPEKKDIGKNAYYIKGSNHNGWKAKVSVGADGDIFELVENSMLSSGKDETGKNKGVHIESKTWDYYTKSVQIDGKVYDAIINVRNTDTDSFVYYIELRQNKKLRASPPGRIAKNNPYSSGAQHSQLQYTQSEEKINVNCKVHRILTILPPQKQSIAWIKPQTKPILKL